MSMICNLRQVNDAKVDELLAAPDKVVLFLYGPQQAAPPSKPGLFARLFGKRRPHADQLVSLSSPSAGGSPGWTPPSDDEQVDLDKAWHGIHYLLTSSDWGGEEPWCYLVKGGAKVGDVDVGYGPARALYSHQVKAFHQALSSVTPEMLLQRYDPQKMLSLDIYPSIWHRAPEDDDAFGYLREYFDILVSFLRQTCDKNLGVLVWLN